MERTEKIKLYANSLKDPIYAIETFLKTYDLTQKGFVPFKLFHKQKDIIKSYEKYDRNIVTKPTTSWCIYNDCRLCCGEDCLWGP